jgi:hypothetical protein
MISMISVQFFDCKDFLASGLNRIMYWLSVYQERSCGRNSLV